MSNERFDLIKKERQSCIHVDSRSFSIMKSVRLDQIVFNILYWQSHALRSWRTLDFFSFLY